MRYLLDTNIVSDLVRQPQGRIAERIRRVGEAWVCTSIIVAAELRYAAAKQDSPRLTAQLEAVLGSLDILPFGAGRCGLRRDPRGPRTQGPADRRQ
jgi:tRNA(fMet)-specific endonuclease VapC